MAIDPYLPLEQHSVADLAMEIRRLNQVCFEHELAREQLELKLGAFVEGERLADETVDFRALRGFVFGLVLALLAATVFRFVLGW